jgi:hypothetical protein
MKIIDRDVRAVLKKFPYLIVHRGSKHLKITHPTTGAWVAAPTTGSDRRGWKNLLRALKFLDKNGYNPVHAQYFTLNS